MNKLNFLALVFLVVFTVSTSSPSEADANNGITMWCTTASSHFRLDGGREVTDLDWCVFSYEEALRAYRATEDGPYALFTKSAPFQRKVIDNGVRVIPSK